MRRAVLAKIAVAAAALAVGVTGCGGPTARETLRPFADECREALLWDGGVPRQFETRKQVMEVMDDTPGCSRVGTHLSWSMTEDEVATAWIRESDDLGQLIVIFERFPDLYDPEEVRPALAEKEERRIAKAMYAAWEKKAIASNKAEKRRPTSHYDDPPPTSSGRGSCVYDPTINKDWHDDYVCDGVRQYFRPWDDFVTPEEMEAAAREWEQSQ